MSCPLKALMGGGWGRRGCRDQNKNGPSRKVNGPFPSGGVPRPSHREAWPFTGLAGVKQKKKKPWNLLGETVSPLPKSIRDHQNANRRLPHILLRATQQAARLKSPPGPTLISK